MSNLVLKNQVMRGTVNAGKNAFEAAVRDLGVFMKRWLDAVRNLITGRYPVEQHLDLVMGKAGGTPSSDWLDVSVPLYTGMVHWPDNPAVEIRRILDMNRGDACNVSALSMGAHTGTHMDAPLHFVQGGAGMEAMPIEATIGPCRVVEVRDPESIKAEDVAAAKPQAGERILFKTRNSGRCWKTDGFAEDFVYISARAAEALAKANVRTVGVDYLSVGGFRNDGHETHRALLHPGIWVTEGLDLSKVDRGNYDLVRLPLKIQRGDGAPSRAVLRPIRGRGGSAAKLWRGSTKLAKTGRKRR